MSRSAPGRAGVRPGGLTCGQGAQSASGAGPGALVDRCQNVDAVAQVRGACVRASLVPCRGRSALIRARGHEKRAVPTGPPFCRVPCLFRPLLPAEAHTPVTFPVIDQDMVTLREFALQNFNGQGVFDFPLDGPLQRPGAKGRIIAGINQKTLGLFCEGDPEPAFAPDAWPGGSPECPQSAGVPPDPDRGR